MSQTPPPKTPPSLSSAEERLWMPDDHEGLLSVLLYATTLHLHGENTELAYTHEVDVQKIRGLTRIPRNVERSNNEWLATHVRLYGPISQLAITRRVLKLTPWTFFAFVLTVLAILGFYLSYYPDAWFKLEVFWAAWGIYASIAVLVGFAVFLFMVMSRRKRRRL